MRLAFSAAIHVNPDILLVDEALAVGDVLFQHQCIRRIREMQASGTTIVFVSHDMGMMRSICTEAILLDRGRIEAHDDPATIANIYHAKTSANAEAASQTSGRTAFERRRATAPVTFRAEGDFDERVRCSDTEQALRGFDTWSCSIARAGLSAPSSSTRK